MDDVHERIRSLVPDAPVLLEHSKKKRFGVLGNPLLQADLEPPITKVAEVTCTVLAEQFIDSFRFARHGVLKGDMTPKV
jgi:hypothetical protein